MTIYLFVSDLTSYPSGVVPLLVLLVPAEADVPVAVQRRVVDVVPLPDTRDEFPIIDVLSIRNGRLRYEDRRAQVSLDIRIATLDGSANDARDTRVKGRGTGESPGRTSTK